MRKLSYSFMVSLDGFIETPDQSLDWVLIDEEIHTYVNNQQRDIGLYLYGRRLYELMADYWPTAEADPNNEAFIIEFSRIWKAMPKLVFSKTLDTVSHNAQLSKGDVVEEVRKLKAQPGKTISIGGAAIAKPLLENNLVDEVEVFIMPVVLGRGRPMFPISDTRLTLKLLDSHIFKSGAVFLRYERVEQKGNQP
jgi:dihydrofolate reductase